MPANESGNYNKVFLKGRSYSISLHYYLLCGNEFYQLHSFFNFFLLKTYIIKQCHQFHGHKRRSPWYKYYLNVYKNTFL